MWIAPDVQALAELFVYRSCFFPRVRLVSPVQDKRYRRNRISEYPDRRIHAQLFTRRRCRVVWCHREKRCRTLRTFGRVITATKEQLITTLMFIVILLIISSSLMYFIEKDYQPNVFSSIPASMWWGITTLTTVGYGDMAPVSIMGKIVASIVSILGIGLFVLPAGILGSAFMEEIRSSKAKPIKCPHCEKEFKTIEP